MGKIILDVSMLVFVIASMFGVGLALTAEEIIKPLRKVKLVFLALLSNFVLIPILTYIASRLLKLDKSLFAGLMIMACCAGAPFLPMLARIAGGSIAFGVGLMIVLMVVTVFYAPFVIPLAIPGVTINPLSIAQPLVIYMLLPLFIGMIIKALKPAVADIIKPFVNKLTAISVLIVVILALFIASPAFVRAYGTGVYNATALFVIGSILVGYIFSGLKTADKYIM
ncbi:MAG: bile acid:sodium symporter, partial [Candidatus Margulisiibacteriota bacterium]